MPIASSARGRLASHARLAAVMLLLAGCSSVTPIGKLLDNSSRYDGKSVKIEGQVTQAAGALGLGAYQVQDNTGTITVLSEKGSPPPTGAKIGVKGTFQALATLGVRSLAVLREESRWVP